MPGREKHKKYTHKVMPMRENQVKYVYVFMARLENLRKYTHSDMFNRRRKPQRKSSGKPARKFVRAAPFNAASKCEAKGSKRKYKPWAGTRAYTCTEESEQRARHTEHNEAEHISVGILHRRRT